MTLFSGALAAEFWLRWLHYFFGILWIGHLYYFNFSQGAFLAEADAATKTAVAQKLTPKTMYWFRWGAMFTFLTGWAMIGHRMGSMGVGYLSTGPGILILTGGILGTLMFLNVWLIIWPIQQQVIANADRVAKGEQPLAGIADKAARAGIASRTNTLFSIPLLFFMAAPSHLPVSISAEKSLIPYWCTFGLIAGLIEFNAIKGKMGPMQKIVGTIHFGLALALVLYFAVYFLAG